MINKRFTVAGFAVLILSLSPDSLSQHDGSLKKDISDEELDAYVEITREFADVSSVYDDPQDMTAIIEESSLDLETYNSIHRAYIMGGEVRQRINQKMEP